jgi:hypothetical protein
VCDRIKKFFALYVCAEGKRLLASLRSRREDNIKLDFKGLG